MYDIYKETWDALTAEGSTLSLQGNRSSRFPNAGLFRGPTEPA